MSQKRRQGLPSVRDSRELQRGDIEAWRTLFSYKFELKWVFTEAGEVYRAFRSCNCCRSRLVSHCRWREWMKDRTQKRWMVEFKSSTSKIFLLCYFHHNSQFTIHNSNPKWLFTIRSYHHHKFQILNKTIRQNNLSLKIHASTQSQIFT